MLENLKTEVAGLGKPQWRPMLSYTADLHERSIHPPVYPFELPWEEIGPGYFASPAFGHWDIVHQILDVLPSEPEHAGNQIINDLANQMEDGMVPGSIWMKGEQPRWSKTCSHPPVWPAAVQEYWQATGDLSLVAYAFDRLLRQIAWFENNRKAEPAGYFYLDILRKGWESGVDEGVRFDETLPGQFACVDATSHVYWLYHHAKLWAEILGRDAKPFEHQARALADFIQNELFDPETGFFYDVWSVRNPQIRHLTFEGMWPLVVGAAAPEQAHRAIDENILNPDRFLTPHPISSVAASDVKFELRCWRGPTWNSMTFWAARGCCTYGRADAACVLLENALDSSARQFERTGKIWEFYHPYGDDPLTLARKPHTNYNHPCPDYLGHNPLIAMARLWESCLE
jgi:putative isomerase